MQISKDYKEPLHEQLSQLIKDQITSGVYRENEKIPSVRSIMHDYKLSMETVRRSLKNLSKEGWLTAVPQKGYFVQPIKVDYPASKTDKAQLIAVLANKNGRDFESIGSDPIYKKLIFNIEKELEDHNYLMVQKYLDNTTPHYYEKISNLLERVDGVIYPYGEDIKLVELIRRNNLPLISILPERKFYSIDTVTVDQEKAFYDATKYLIKLGHKSIVYVDAIENTNAHNDRINGFRLAMEEEDLTADEHSFIQIDAWTVEAVKSVFDQIDKTDLATAYITTDDILALGIIKSMQKMNISIPDEVNIIGAKDTLIATTATPELTSIDFQDHELVKKAVNILISRIEGDTSPYQSINMLANLIERETTRNR